MGAKSRRKGASGERELAKWLKDNFNDEASRTAQRTGLFGLPDIQSRLLAPYHVEVKRISENPSHSMVKGWYWQAYRDCLDERTPIVCWRRDRGQWKITMKLGGILWTASLRDFCKELGSEQCLLDQHAERGSTDGPVLGQDPAGSQDPGTE